jgi:hypothetical protein
MNGKAKGARAERRVIRILEAAGYVCTKGSSVGLFDVAANRPVGRALHSGEGERVSVSGGARIDQGAADAGERHARVLALRRWRAGQTADRNLVMFASRAIPDHCSDEKAHRGYTRPERSLPVIANVERSRWVNVR